MVFLYGALTLSGDPFQTPSTNHRSFSLPRRPADRHQCSHNPAHTTPSRALPLTNDLSHSPAGRQTDTNAPTTPSTQPLPGITCDRFSLKSAFARHYSRNHGCFLFLWVLRCFTSPRSLHTPYVFKRGSHHMTGAGFPHSDTLGSTLGWQLPEAYRSLPRPSSAPDAQASTVCP